MNEKYILICTDSIEGIFTGVYDGWKYGNEGAQVELCTEPPSQPEFFSRYETVESDPEKAGKVMRTIWRELGRASYEQLCYAACSTDEEKGTCIYYALRDGLSRRRGNPAVLENLKNPHILKISKLRQTVWHEMHRFLGFVRFQEIRDGILFAAICPDNAILPLIGPHFADRLPREDWIIYDEGRAEALLHPAGKPWYIQRQAVLDGPVEEEDGGYAALWKTFCKNISVAEREILRAQRQNLPYKYRRYMPEFW